MSSEGRGELTSTESEEKREGEFLGRLRVAATNAVLVGAVVSVGLMLRAGRHNDSKFLLVLMAIWVLSPFMLLLGANVVSKSWPVLTRATLYGVMLVIALGTLAIYGANAVWPPKAQAAFVFVAVPPLSWLLTAIVIVTASLISGRLPRRG